MIILMRCIVLFVQSDCRLMNYKGRKNSATLGWRRRSVRRNQRGAAEKRPLGIQEWRPYKREVGGV